MFYISASIYAFGTIFFGLFGSGEVQSWALPSMSIPDLKIGVTTEVPNTPPVTKHNEEEGEEINNLEKRENPLYIYLASAGQMQLDGRCK